MKASTVDATLKRLFAPASKRENPEGDFNPSAVGSSKEMKKPSMSLSHRGKQVEVVCLPKMLTVLPKGPKRTTLKDMGLIKNITVSHQLSETAIYDKLACTFPDMLHSNVHPPCIYLCATSTSQLAKAGLPAGMVQWNGEAILANMAGGSLYIVPNHSVTSTSVLTTTCTVTPTPDVISYPPSKTLPPIAVTQPLPRPPPPTVVIQPPTTRLPCTAVVAQASPSSTVVTQPPTLFTQALPSSTVVTQPPQSPTLFTQALPSSTVVTQPPQSPTLLTQAPPSSTVVTQPPPSVVIQPLTVVAQPPPRPLTPIVATQTLHRPPTSHRCCPPFSKVTPSCSGF